MSQYPSPYQQPPYQQPPPGYPMDYSAYYSDPLAPGKRAAIMMYVTGAIMLIMGSCAGIVLAMLPELMKNPEFSNSMSRTPGMTTELLHTAMLYTTIVMLGLGVFTILLGLFTARGSMAAAVIGIVVTTLIVLFQLFQAAMFFINTSRTSLPGPAMAGATCFTFVPLILFVAQLFFLILAARGAGRARAMREQQQYFPYGYPAPTQQQYGGPPPADPYAPYRPPPPPGGGVVPRYPGYQPPQPPPQQHDQPPPPPRGPDDAPPSQG
jgi:hypothetical protein